MTATNTAGPAVKRPPLVLAAHGTRIKAGQDECFGLGERVAAMLPDVQVEMGFVELVEPEIDVALRTALAGRDAASGKTEPNNTEPHAVVVPLMVSTGSHVMSDIPEAIAKGGNGRPIAYARPLSPDVRMQSLLGQRIAEAMAPADGDQWKPEDTTVVVIGRGTLTPEANAEHCRVTRIVGEQLGLSMAIPAFIQVVAPNVAQGLAMANSVGAKQIVVAPNFLFPGRLQDWVNEQAAAWAADFSDLTVRVADVLGDCDDLAQVVVDRYITELN